MVEVIKDEDLNIEMNEVEQPEESVEEENIVEESPFPEIDPNVLDKSLKDIKIEVTDADKAKYNKEVPKPPTATEKKKPGRQPKAKADLPTPMEVEQMTDQEVEDGMDQKTKDLYMEFNSFLEDKTDIKSDTGTKEIIPTGIDVLDTIMGGGFAIGGMGVITGNPGSGKSMIAIQCIGAAQRKYNGNIISAMLDSEEATTTIRMANLGVKNPRLKPYNDITVEKVFKFLEGMCLYKEMKKIMDTPSIVIWDSVANTLSQREREAEDINSVIGYKGRLLSLLIPKYVAKLSSYNICLIAINQLRDVISIGNFAPAKELKFMTQGKTMPGGNSLKFNAFHLLEMKPKDVATVEKFGFNGFFAEVNCVKNKLFTPNIKIQIAGNFVTGFSNFWTNFRFLVDNKRIVTGAWNYIVDLPEKKIRTKEMEIMYNTDPLFKEAFDKAVQETLQTELVEKFNPTL